MKSTNLFFTAIFLTAIASCNNEKNEWINGNDDKDSRDSVFHGNHYRYYHGAWYPIYYKRINPGVYNGASLNEVSSPSFTPSVRSGGFGSSAHSSSTSAGE